MSASTLELCLWRCELEKLVVRIKYPQTASEVPSTKDTIGLFEEGSTTPIAAVNVGSPWGHWQEGVHKVGLVNINTTNVEFTDNQLYKIAYVRDSTDEIISNSIVILSFQDGVLTPQVISDEDFTCIPGPLSINLGSFESPKSIGEPSSSFVVVPESEPMPQVTNYVESLPEPTDPPEQWIESHEDQPENILCVESEDTVLLPDSLEEPVKFPATDFPLSELPNQMSVSVNVSASDRHVSQREAQSLKSVNKDLILKQKKLTEIIQSLQGQLAKALENSESSDKVRALEQKIKSLQKEIKVLKNDNKQLKDEREALLVAEADHVKEKQGNQATIRGLQKK